MSKPRVLIAMASGILGGPGKGLEQFLRHGGLDLCSPLIIDYVTGKEQGTTEFVKVIQSTGAPMASLQQKKVLDFNLVQQGLELIEKHNIEVLQSHGYKSHLLCLLLHRKTKLPWIAYVHGWTQENMKVRLYTVLEHVLLLFAPTVIAVSESLRSRLLSPVRNRAEVIPNALAAEELVITQEKSITRQELGIADSALVLGIVGRLSPEKGHALFFRALASLRAQGIEAHALIVGHGQEYEPLQDLAQSLQLEKHCSFVGHVRHTANYYNAMDIQVMPSTTEGMPNAALEGMYMKLPLVASHVGGIPEVVLQEKTGLLFPSGNEQAFTKALLRLAQDTALRKNMGQAGRERVEKHFTPNIRARRILDQYNKALRKI